MGLILTKMYMNSGLRLACRSRLQARFFGLYGGQVGGYKWLSVAALDTPQTKTTCEQLHPFLSLQHLHPTSRPRMHANMKTKCKQKQHANSYTPLSHKHIHPKQKQHVNSYTPFPSTFTPHFSDFMDHSKMSFWEEEGCLAYCTVRTVTPLPPLCRQGKRAAVLARGRSRIFSAVLLVAMAGTAGEGYELLHPQALRTLQVRSHFHGGLSCKGAGGLAGCLLPPSPFTAWTLHTSPHATDECHDGHVWAVFIYLYIYIYIYIPPPCLLGAPWGVPGRSGGGSG